MKNLIGQSLDRYQIVSLLGEGGMGAVFKARDVTLQRDVAVKVMHPQFANRPNFQERFLQEARTVARFDHPGIVKVFDFGQAKSLLYIVMELIPGDNLRKLLQDLKASGKWIVLPEAVQLVRQVALALDYAHHQGVLHRDIKPDNIMLKAEPGDTFPYRPVLTDLGLAKLLEGGLVTQEGSSMGTPAYMSPEQALGEATDARSDVYSIGVLLYELAVGRLPFHVKTITEAIRYHTKEPPPPPRSIRPDLPEPLERVILRALAKDPADRFPTAAGLAKALADVLPAATAATVAPTAMEGAASLMTQYQQSIVADRGPSILQEFPEAPSGSQQDRLMVMAPDGSVRAEPIKGKEITIGRGSDNSLVLDYQKISRHHAKIEFDGTDYKVSDLDSTNGTYLANVKLLPGIPEVWPSDKPIRVGDIWIRLERAKRPAQSVLLSNGTMAALSAVRSSPGAGRVGMFAETSALSVEPGSSVSVPIILLNQGPVVDHFEVAVEGIPPEWIPASLPLIQLLPGTQQEVVLSIQPPRASQSRAGRYSLKIRAASQDAPDQVAELAATLTVGMFSEFNMEVRPQKVQAGKPAQVRVENRGNTPQTFDVAWQDRANELAFNPPQAQLKVTEGQAAATEFRAEPRHRRLIGGAKAHAFSTQVSSPDGTAQTLAGELQSKALIPTWLPPLILIPLLALCLLLAFWFTRAPAIRSAIVDPAEPIAGQPVTIRWEIDNAQTVELRPLVSGLDPRAGEYTFPQGLPASTNLTIVASNRFRSTEKQLAIGVSNPTPTPSPEPGAPVVETWSVFPTEVTKGQSVTIKWQVSNADSVTLQPFGTVDNAGEQTDTPQQTKTYTLIATNQGKTVQKSQEVVVTIPPPDAPKVKSFTVEPSSLVKGQVATVRLTWDTEQADTVTIEPAVGAVGPAGSRDVPAPDKDTVYTLVAKNAGGEGRAQAQVTVSEALCTVTTNDLNFRTGPGTVYEPPIRKLSSGTRLTPLSRSPDGQWIEVKVQQTGETGWVSAAASYVSCNVDVPGLPQGTVPPTPTPLPTATPSPTPTTPPFAVTGITAQVTPESHVGCPETFNFSATITVNRPGTVQYKWERSDGAGAPTETVTFAAAGSKTVNDTWNLGTAGSYWERVRIMSPNSIVSNKATFTLSCVSVIIPPVVVVPLFPLSPYNLVTNADKATWSSGAGNLPWPGAGNDDRGFARWVENATLEDGTTASKVLEMHPQWVDNGFVSGTFTDIYYSGYVVQAGDHFKATVGFLEGAGAGNVRFRVMLRPQGGSNTWVASVTDSYDGNLKTIDKPLDAWAGKKIDFILRVEANGSSSQDWAVWKYAYISR